MAKSTKRTHAGRRYPARVDTLTAQRADRTAAREGLPPAELTGEAITFWVNLPSGARDAWRALMARGNTVARRAAGKEVARLLRSWCVRLVSRDSNNSRRKSGRPPR